MSTVNTTIHLNEGCPQTPGTYHVRAFYEGAPDAGHLYGPFASRERAEQAALALAARAGVLKALIEEAV